MRSWRSLQGLRCAASFFVDVPELAQQYRVVRFVFFSLLSVFVGLGCSGGAEVTADGGLNGWRQFRGASGLTAYCEPGSVVSTQCWLTQDLPCRGNPEIRVCEVNGSGLAMDCASGRLRVIGEFRNELAGHCPAGQFTCPSSGEYVMVIRSITPGQSFVCPNEA